MKEFAAIGAAALIAAAAALWFSTRPTLVMTEIRPLRASPDLPTFNPVPSPYDGASSASPRSE